MLRAVQRGRLVLRGAQAVRGGRAPPQRLQAQVGTVPVGLARLGRGVAAGEVTSWTAFAHGVAHRRP